MAVLSNNTIISLNADLESFCNTVKYREGEEFYSKKDNIIELSYNENPLGPGKLAREVIKQHADYAHLYPPVGYNLLIEKLSNKLNLKPENFIIAPGSVFVISLAISQATEKNNQVIFSKSSLPWYKWGTLGNNALPIEVPLKEDMNHDLENIFKNVTNETRAIIISNPHNPTGLYIDEKELLTLLEKIPENVLLIVDQAYYEYQSIQETVLIDAIQKYSNLLLTRTFSKIHGLAGLRIGYGMSNSALIKKIKAKWLQYLPAVTSVSAYVALHALDDEEHIKKSREFNNKAKQQIYELAEKKGIQCLNSEGNFVALKMKDSKTVEKLFNNKNIKITPGYVFGYEEWVRMSFNINLNCIINTFITLK
jgi:histidinol-phosphate aminotransferase